MFTKINSHSIITRSLLEVLLHHLFLIVILLGFRIGLINRNRLVLDLVLILKIVISCKIKLILIRRIKYIRESNFLILELLLLFLTTIMGRILIKRK